MNPESNANVVDWAMVFSGISAAVAAIGVAVGLLIYALQARLSRRLQEADLLLQFIRDYGDPAFDRALKLLRDWWAKDGMNGVGSWNVARLKREPWAIELDAARRLLKTYFLMPMTLYRNGFITKRVARVAVDRAGAAIFLRICEPMDLAINPGYQKWIYDGVSSLLKMNKQTGLIDKLPAAVVEPSHGAESMAAVP